METNPIRVCELLVGLPDVTVLGVDAALGEPIRVYVETRRPRPVCVRCGTAATVKERPLVELVDLPVFGRPARLGWRKYRFACVDPGCPVGSWTEHEPWIAPPDTRRVPAAPRTVRGLVASPREEQPDRVYAVVVFPSGQP